MSDEKTYSPLMTGHLDLSESSLVQPIEGVTLNGQFRSTITFCSGNPNEPMLKLDKDGFHYNGSIVKDAGKAYELFMRYINNPMPNFPASSFIPKWEEIPSKIPGTYLVRLVDASKAVSVMSLVSITEDRKLNPLLGELRLPNIEKKERVELLLIENF